MSAFVKTAATACVVLLAGVAHAEGWRDYFEAKSSEFSSAVSLLGQPREEGGTEDSWRTTLFGSIRKKDGSLAGAGVGLNNTYLAKAPRRWSRATTNSGESLKVDVSDRRVRQCNPAGCFIDETFTIYLPPETVERAAAQDLRIRVVGAGGEPSEYIFSIDRAEAKALLEAIGEVSSGLRVKQ